MAKPVIPAEAEVAIEVEPDEDEASPEGAEPNVEADEPAVAASNLELELHALRPKPADAHADACAIAKRSSGLSVTDSSAWRVSDSVRSRRTDAPATVVFVSQILHGFFYGITIPLLWAMIADVADYSEWKNNRRATAIIFSAMLFGLKGGLTIGGALVAGLLDLYGYTANAATQSAETINGIKLSVSIYASLPFLIAAGLLFWYEINKDKEVIIERDLEARRKAAGVTVTNV